MVVATIALMALAPLLAAIWIVIRLTSRGPGIYWSARVGWRQRLFWMPKFRTMAHEAPVAPRELLRNASTQVTPVGKILRRWGLDELPQLICIISGTMSLVGPRPLMTSDPALLARVLLFPDSMSVRPGLSGLAQVLGRNLVSPRRKARLDALYARTRSWRLDVEICARTIAVLLTGRGFI